MIPDSTDWQIINTLRRENVSNRIIADKLGVSEGMVRQRLKRLKDAGILTIRALINPEMLENQQLALIAVNVASPDMLEKKAEELAKLPNVLSVSAISGRYDLMVHVLVDSNRGLVHFLTGTLPSVKGIASIETFVMLKCYNMFV
jgi:Lrp/AsnC family transcriptional regulator for asnA, asnC and gidA